MTSRADLELARRLLSDRVLTEDRVREALQVQAAWLQKGKRYSLERVLYARGDLPANSLALLSAPPLLESQPFANYRLDEELGEGGMGTVYGGVYTPNDTPVAIKVLDPVKALRDMHRERFYHEAQLHIDLEHDNLVAGYEVGLQGGYHFYTMDRIEGLTALEVIDRRGRLTNEEALSITLQAAYALAYLHEQGYIHRDTKPGNIIVEASGWARLIDLGLVCRMAAGEQTPTGEMAMTVGTVEYLSPEQARGRMDLDARADMYSLGMTLYHMVVGEVAFQGESDYEVMAQQILSSMDTQKIKTRRIDPEIYFLITKMSSKDRDERWADLSEAIEVIEGYLPNGIVAVDLGDAPPSAVKETREAPPAAKPLAPRRTRRTGKGRGDADDSAPRRSRRGRPR